MSNFEYSDDDLNDWIDAIENQILFNGEDNTRRLISLFLSYAENKNLIEDKFKDHPFENTVSADEEERYPGDLKIEEKITNVLRWNALAMVLRANKNDDLGGHISTYASALWLYEVGFNHFFRSSDEGIGDMIYFQGHSSPGIYARSFLEGRFNSTQLSNFRREIKGDGLSSYPHPWLMPDYWQFPTVSMGLGPIMSIYQAHVMRYLENRGLLENNQNRKVIMFCGDGEMDEPESLGAISLAARENLNNLIFVVNCNLQRLDGPVRGNSRIITELGNIFKAAGWNVINLIWGSNWDVLLQNDKSGALRWVMNNTVDGEYQNFKSKGGAYTREHFFGKHPDALKLVENMSDQEIEDLMRGGHDPIKIFNAYQKAYNSSEKPSVILAFTVKGFGVGSKQADNATHQVKKLDNENIAAFVKRFSIPLSSDQIEKLEFLKFDENSDEYKYLKEKRKLLGGFLPARSKSLSNLIPENNDIFESLSQEVSRESSTTMIFVKLLTALLRDKYIGKNIVPIVPDEARTFGMDGLFRQFGIYSSEGQKYKPEDSEKVMWYRESKDGVILEEGINEAGAFSAWLALATSYANNKLPMIPFYIYYSMFGFQRIHDLAWAAGDSRAKGFLLGATAGRTTLNGEGLQHQDGHSHIFAQTIPNCRSYDPCYSYELATIIKYGIKDMYELNNDVYYYLTLMNENYSHPKKPENATDKAIISGCYKFIESNNPSLRIIASGITLRFAVDACKELEQMGIETEVWSATSFNELARGGLDAERANLINDSGRRSYVDECFSKNLTTVAVSEYVRAYSEQIRRWVNGTYVCLGTDGYGRSDTRENLREFFEISKKNIIYTALVALNRREMAQKYLKENKLELKKENPWEI